VDMVPDSALLKPGPSHGISETMGSIIEIAVPFNHHFSLLLLAPTKEDEG